MHDILIGVLQEREVDLGHLQGQLALLVQGHLQCGGERGLDGCAIKLCIMHMRASERGQQSLTWYVPDSECYFHMRPSWTRQP